MIARDHDHADARLVAARDSIGNLRPRRIEHRHEAQKAQIPLGLLAPIGRIGAFVEQPVGEAEDSQSGRGVRLDRVRHGSQLIGSEGPFGIVAPEDPRAAREQLLGCALGMNPQTAVELIDGAHPLEHWVEMEMPAPQRLALLGGELSTERLSGLEQRDLGGITARTGRGVELRVVARCHHGRQPLRDCYGRFVHRADVDRALRGPDAFDVHPVFGQGARLIGADHVRRAERLDGAEPFHDSAAANQFAHADREGQGDHGQQPLGNIADQQPDGEHDPGRQGQSGDKGRDRDERQPGQHGDQRDQPRDAADLPLERALLAGYPLGERSDPADLRVHPGREHDGARLPLGAGRAAEHNVTRKQQRHVWVRQIRGTEHRHRFAGQHRRVDFDPAAQQPRVGGDPLALLDHQHIAGHQRPRLDHLVLTVAHHLGLSREELRERLDRSLGLHLLDEGERRVDQDHDDDRHRHRHDPRDPSKHRGRNQQQSERVSELPRQLARPATASPALELIGPELDQTPLRLARGEPVDAAPEMAHQKIDRFGRIRRGGYWRRLLGHRPAHIRRRAHASDSACPGNADRRGRAPASAAIRASVNRCPGANNSISTFPANLQRNAVNASTHAARRPRSGSSIRDGQREASAWLGA